MAGGSGGCKPAEVLEPAAAEVAARWPAAAPLLLPAATAASLEAQVARLKEVVAGVDASTEAAAAEVLVLWYFNCPLRSAVRKVVGGVMNSVKGSLVDLLTKEVATGVERILGEEDTAMVVSR